MRDVSHPLLVDLYELTMASAYRREGMAGRPATFSLFVRALPPERGYLVAAGLDDALGWLEGLRFSDDDLAVIDRLGLFDDEFLSWLGELRFTGSVRAVPEGTVVFPPEPLLEVDAPVGEAQLAETFLLNQMTLQTTLASKAARLRHAAGDRLVVDFALRRTQGIDAGMKLARVSRLVGLAGTSNVDGADRYGLVASGTVAHAFIQAYRRSEAMQIAFDRYSLKVPIFGDVIKKSVIARWTRTLATMFSAGVPLVESLESVGGAAGNHVYKVGTRQIQGEVSTGTSLTNAMQNSNLFPNMVTQMVAIGEEFTAGFGVDPGRVRFEDGSGNTCEGARATRELVQPGPGERWLLVTSSFHLPRAVGCFRAAEWEVVPYPTDYRRAPRAFHLGLVDNLEDLDLAAHEWLGLVYYRLRGYTHELFPAPRRL